jgi:uncharacterized protein YndB with AHSA1/START domain
MIDFTVEVDIDRPVNHVFAYSTDPEKLPTWQTNTVSSVPEQEGPLAVGSRLREVHRGPGGKEFESLVEVTEYDPDRRFALRVIEGTPVHATMTFEPTADGGTHLRFRAFGKLTGAMRLAEPFLGRMLKRQFAEQVATLKRVLEQDAELAA